MRFWTHAPKLAVPADLKPYGLLVRSDGRQLALPGKGEAVVWDLPDRQGKTFSLVPRAGWQRASEEPAFLADGRLLVVEQMQKDKRVRLTVRDVVSGQEVGPGIATTLGEPVPNLLPAAGIAVRLSADARLLLESPVFMLPSHKPIVVWDVASGNRLGELSSPDQEGNAQMQMILALSPDNKWLCSLHSPSNDVMSMSLSQFRLRVWDVPNRRQHCDLQFSGWLSAGIFSADSRLFAIASDTGFVELWDIQAKELLFQWQPLGAGEVKHLAFTADAAFLAASGDHAPIHLLHLGELRKQLADMGLDW